LYRRGCADRHLKSFDMDEKELPVKNTPRDLAAGHLRFTNGGRPRPGSGPLPYAREPQPK
jgi:hypothetical protein